MTLALNVLHESAHRFAWREAPPLSTMPGPTKDQAGWIVLERMVRENLAPIFTAESIEQMPELIEQHGAGYVRRAFAIQELRQGGAISPAEQLRTMEEFTRGYPLHHDDSLGRAVRTAVRAVQVIARLPANTPTEVLAKAHGLLVLHAMCIDALVATKLDMLNPSAAGHLLIRDGVEDAAVQAYSAVRGFEIGLEDAEAESEADTEAGEPDTEVALVRAEGELMDAEDEARWRLDELRAARP